MRHPWLVPGALLLAHAALGGWSARRHAAVFDEPMHLAAGLSYWKTGDLRMDPNNPPLAKLWAAAPLAPRSLAWPEEGPEWRGAYHYAFGERFLYWSGNDADSLILAGRLTTLALSLLLGGALWSWCRSRWGEGPAALGLALYAFSPTVLAHASLATGDFPACAAAVASALAFASFLERPRREAALAAGALAAAGFLCKYSAVLLWPAFAAALLAVRRRLPAGAATAFLVWGFLPFLGASLLHFAAAPGGWDGFCRRLAQVLAEDRHPNFLLGRLAQTGSPWYYLVAASVKSTLPELAVLPWLAWSWRRLAPRDKSCAAALLALAGAYFAAASISRKQIGIRYVLPLYPCLAALGAAAFAASARSPWARPAALLLALGQAATSLAAAPHALAYFNEAAGGPEAGRRLLGDSNLDWGQDLKGLAEYWREEGRPELVLSYFGTASPEYYGLKVQNVLSHNAIQRRSADSLLPKRELFAVSETNRQGLYSPVGPVFGWLEGRRPARMIGRGIAVYDVTGDAEFHESLAGTYDRLGDAELAAWERRRAEASGRKR